MKIPPLISRVLLLVLALSFSSFAAAPKNVGYKTGQTLPDLRAKDQYGRSVSLRSLKGRNLIIEFCAAWCEPCQEMAPAIPAVLASLEAAGQPTTYVVVMVEGVQQGRASGFTEALYWMYDNDLTTPVLHADGSDAVRRKLFSEMVKFGNGGELPQVAVPTMVFADSAQKIVAYGQGYLTPAQVQSVFAPDAPAPSVTTPAARPNLTSIDLKISVGANSGSIDNIPMNLSESDTTGTLPSQLQAYTSSFESTFTHEPDIGVQVRREDYPAYHIPHDQPLSFEVSDLQWEGVKIGALSELRMEATVSIAKTVSVQGQTFLLTEDIHTARVPVTLTASGFTVSPFTLAQIGVPADAKVFNVAMSPRYVFDSVPLALRGLYQSAIATPLPLRFRAGLASLLDRALVQSAPGANKKYAVDHLGRFISALAAYPTGARLPADDQLNLISEALRIAQGFIRSQ